MKQLSHWNPFKSLARAEPAGFDEYFRNFGVAPFIGKVEIPDIRLDISETEKTYAIRADIPGAKKEDIDVFIDGSQVTISATMSSKAARIVAAAEAADVFDEERVAMYAQNYPAATWPTARRFCARGEVA